MEVVSSSMKVLPNKLIRFLLVQDRKGEWFWVPAHPIAGAQRPGIWRDYNGNNKKEKRQTLTRLDVFLAGVP